GSAHRTEAARDDLGSGEEGAGLWIDRGRHHKHPGLAEELAVAKDHRADVAHALPVHQHAAGRIAAEDARARPGHLEPEAVLHEKDTVRGNADALREPGM